MILDGLIQEIIKAVDNKAEEIEKELQEKEKPAKKSKSKEIISFDLKIIKN